VPLVHGFCFFVRPKVLDQIGEIDAGAFPSGYGSDFDLSLRAEAAGYQNYVWSGTYVWHQGSRSAGRDQRRIRSIGADFVLKKRYGAAYADARFRTRNRMRIHLGNLVDFS
jgi:O-antigen biosynthesis protein